MGKVTLGIGLGVGYVLGARAGRDRYQQIVQAAQSFLRRPEVQQTVGKVRDAAPAPLRDGIDQLTGQGSGGQGSGGRGSSGQGTSAGTAGAGTTGVGIGGSPIGVGTADPQTIAETVVSDTPASEAGSAGRATGSVPDPLIPPTRSNG
ncbi:hypothetical protein [Geodermatophilus sp. URMC 62]|uniref:hypothetical protein n=1 Tax=Geodermatophilus sp. URMC 62 TaxID=3423414 RepID=UPI00406C7DA4